MLGVTVSRRPMLVTRCQVPDREDRVQKRATKMINGFSKFKHETRFKKLELTALETRRLRGDLIEVFKISKGYDDIGEDIFFVRSKSSLKGHQCYRKKC